jgi:hypothetical protein
MVPRYRRAEDVAFRQIADECLLVPVRTDASRPMAVFSLNAGGAELWQELGEPRTEDELVTATVGAFEVEADQARGDVRDFLAQLESKQLIAQVSP